ncbi:hypothetical protein ACP26L_16355 [Paenibacillus sp. S-38]|uniref:hypothetical protein n=1 Tax=Paenibacillus sp. S-38 TaxID=3416710 RepID=UPI003CFAE822
MHGNIREVLRSVGRVREVEGALGQMIRMACTLDEHAQDVSAAAEQTSDGTGEAPAAMVGIAALAEEATGAARAGRLDWSGGAGVQRPAAADRT